MNIEDFYGWMDFLHNPNLSHLSEEEKRILYKKMLTEKEQLVLQNFLLAAGAASAPAGGSGGAGTVEDRFIFTIDTTKTGTGSSNNLSYKLPFGRDEHEQHVQEHSNLQQAAEQLERWKQHTVLRNVSRVYQFQSGYIWVEHCKGNNVHFDVCKCI